VVKNWQTKYHLYLLGIIAPLSGWLYVNLVDYPEKKLEGLNSATEPLEIPSIKNYRQHGGNSIENQATQRTRAKSKASITPNNQILSSEIEVAESTGDFRPLIDSFSKLSQNDKMGHFNRVAAVYSKLGPKHDIEMKLLMLEMITAPSSLLERYEHSILELEARERYESLKEEGIIHELSVDKFSQVCESLANSRIDKGFSAISDGNGEETQRMAARSVARFAVRADLMEAIRAISSLEPGLIRDEAIVEMVLWLRKTGAHQEAITWVNIIQDTKAKSRLK
jgi:hypothetical protein